MVVRICSTFDLIGSKSVFLFRVICLFACGRSNLYRKKWILVLISTHYNILPGNYDCAEATNLFISSNQKFDGLKSSFQQPDDLFFATHAIVVSTMPIVDTVRFIPQKTVDKSFGPLGFDEGYKSPDS